MNQKISAKVFSKLLNISDKSYYAWKNKSRTKLIKLLAEYFSEKDIEEFLETGKIKKLERLKELEDMERKYLEICKLTNGNLHENK